MTLRILVNPLTGLVYAGELNQAGTSFVGKNFEVTDDFLTSLVAFIGFHGGSFYVECAGIKVAILAKEVEK